MVHTPLISIITPALNASSTLAQAIESVRAQNLIGPQFSGWEMIIVDDHSQDSTIALAAHMAEQDERIRVIRCAENGGAARARNKGIEAARGRYIAFLHADDMWAPDKLQQQLDFMHSENAALSASHYRLFRHTPDKTGRVRKTPRTVSFTDLTRYHYPELSTMMIDREHTGPFLFDETLEPLDDLDLLLRLTKTGYDIHTVPQDLARIRKRQGRGFTDGLRRIIALIRIYHRACGRGFWASLGGVLRYGAIAAKRSL